MNFHSAACASGPFEPVIGGLFADVLLSACNGQCKPNVDGGEVFQDCLAPGMAYISNGESQRAKSKLNRAQQRRPRLPEEHGFFGMLFRLESEQVLAKDHYRSALRYDARSTGMRNIFGAEYEKASSDLVIRIISSVTEEYAHYRESLGE